MSEIQRWKICPINIGARVSRYENSFALSLSHWWWLKSQHFHVMCPRNRNVACNVSYQPIFFGSSSVPDVVVAVAFPLSFTWRRYCKHSHCLLWFLIYIMDLDFQMYITQPTYKHRPNKRQCWRFLANQYKVFHYHSMEFPVQPFSFWQWRANEIFAHEPKRLNCISSLFLYVILVHVECVCTVWGWGRCH